MQGGFWLEARDCEIDSADRQRREGRVLALKVNAGDDLDGNDRRDHEVDH